MQEINPDPNFIYGNKLQRWSQIVEIPLTIAAIVFLLAYGWEVIANLHHPNDRIPDTIINIIWGLFGIDYVVRLSITRNRKRWFTRHLPDLLIVLLPFFRPLRLVRLIHLASNWHKRAGAHFRGKAITYIIASAAILILISSLGVLDAEQNVSGANIKSYGDALWWSFVTITTVGYGDYYPVTLEGRLVAVALMISGIALLGSVTATFASWFVEQVNKNKP